MNTFFPSALHDKYRINQFFLFFFFFRQETLFLSETVKKDSEKKMRKNGSVSWKVFYGVETRILPADDKVQFKGSIEDTCHLNDSFCKTVLLAT